MTRIARKSDGRRIFPEEFKRRQIGHVLRGELTIADLSRKLGIARSLLQRWKRQYSDGAKPERANSRPMSALRTSEYIRELQLLVGRQTVELELLRAEVAALKKPRQSPKR